MKKEKKIKEGKKSKEKEFILSFEAIKEMADLGKTIEDLNKLIKEYKEVKNEKNSKK